MKITRYNVSLLYVIIIISLLAFVSISSYVASTNMEKELNSVVNEVIPLSGVAGNIFEDMINQETGLRGYIVSGDERYLESYELGKQQLTPDLEIMANYQKTYPGLKSLMEGDMLPQIKRLQDYYISQILLVQNGNIEDARSRITNGKTMMDRFRQLHIKVITEIDTIADSAYKDANQAGRSARVIIAVGGGLALIIGLLSAFIFSRANRAEAALRKSEETYRYMAESLEAQNEEIIAQQEEQEQTLEKLSQREQELETISTYQEKLTGSLEMSLFLESSIPALLDSLKMDAALLVMKSTKDDDPTDTQGEEASDPYTILYSTGYPQQLPRKVKTVLFGPALRVLTEKIPIECRRDLSPLELGIHQSMSHALDQYYPVFDDNNEVIGFLLLTSYLTTRSEQRGRIAKGLVRQFGLAFLAQLMNEERHRQSIRLEQLNDQLMHEKDFIGNQRDLINNILESTHEGMMFCDSKGTLLFVNHRMSDYISLNQQIDQNWNELNTFINETNPSFMPIYLSIEGLLNGSLDKLTERFVYTDQDNQQRHVELYATKVGDKDNQVGYLFVFRDRTEEEKVDEMKNEFVSIVSHELRTPLASVLGFIEILLHRQLSPEKQQKYMETIYKEANRLSTLINDFLDLQRMESGKQVYHFAPVDLVSLLEEASYQWRSKQSHQLELHVPENEVWIRADSDRFKQIIHNLLSNAIKYSPQANKVDVRIEQNGEQIKLLITDYGLGIPDEAKDKLFSKFYRVDNSDRRQIGGTGLGLAIVKEIVDAHQGSITFISEMGKGTTFTVELKSHKVPSAEDSIIILEDDDNLAKLIQVGLTRLNVRTVHLRSAEEGIIAINQIRSLGPQLCIVDIHLEGTKTGWDFISELYKHPDYFRTPVIVSTALEPPMNYHEKDFEKFLRKPFSMEKLLEVAEQLINNKANPTAYIFPAQDEEHIKNSLEKNGIHINEITRDQDTIQVELSHKHNKDT
ncbi:ATP-binding protein [Paenibacillus radicis (ex Xue et al. 2023)]|uniref:histidine kinase n=1 Tax=Paenibacillus radicis (ex Xue et al. 2023) TaxID=2972489 RepID=A0ABT1YSB0_9BACL|nr:ATP-binding protein [Paenibacillus radicis (ex Xue et al. 2023)]MCR8636066.1 ATP-binding protein [Paenibacillus radicis (ex Xue et al. 2023)]